MSDREYAGNCYSAAIRYFRKALRMDTYMGKTPEFWLNEAIGFASI
jgi:hypothetical protein